MDLQASITIAAGGVSAALLFWTAYSIGRGMARLSPGSREGRRIEERWVRLLLLLAEPLADLVESGQRRGRTPLLHPLLRYYAAQIQAAGLAADLRPAEALMLSPISGLFGLFLGVLAYALWPWPPLVLAFLLLALVLPDIWLRDRVRQRHEEIRRTLPFAIDILTLMVEAGLDFTIALERISQKLRQNALGDEFALAQREIQMGKSRSEAMRHLGQRTGLFELSAVCAAIIQADELGAGFGPVLRIQADQIRTMRAQQVEQKAMEAPVKILFPLIVFIFPITFVIIFGPVFLSYLL